jgi:hypothetical protein
MALPSKTFSGFTADMVAQWSAQLGFTPTLQTGDALYALMQAAASQFVFLQALAFLVNNVARAQTSTGADLDSFYAQFNFSRLQAVQASGSETFAAAAPVASQILIPAGSIVQTVGGAIQYAVVADTTQPTWNASLNAYVLAQGQTSLTATVQATTAGANYNVTAGQLSQLGNNIPGIVAVTNGANIDNGLNAESDSAYMARFPLYLNSLSKATYGAIVSAILGVQAGIRYNLVENVTTSLTPQIGEFVAIVDAGDGVAPASLINAVQAQLEVTRAFTVEAQTIGTSFQAPSISLSVRIAPGATAATVEAAVEGAIATAATATPIGGGMLVNGEIEGAGWLYISEIEAAALAVTNVVAVQPGQTKINGTNADFSLTASQGINISAGDVSCGTY